jgi:hypothetical protein
VWIIVLQAFAFGFVTSLQYTSMNTLVYSDVTPADTSMASSLASTMQQMSMSFGVAVASLATALFIPGRHDSTPTVIVHGIHQAFLCLGALTIVSALIFRELKPADGDNVSQHKVESPEGGVTPHPTADTARGPHETAAD